jgi:Rrf2 family protein
MQNIIRISEAAVIALHAAQLIAKDRKRLSAAQIAAGLGVSYNHLSKVMQRLAKAGFVSPLRGPKGGFSLTRKADKATFRDIIEVIEGPLAFSACLMGERGCGRKNCQFGRLLLETNKKFEKALSQKVTG